MRHFYTGIGVVIGLSSAALALQGQNLSGELFNVSVTGGSNDIGTLTLQGNCATLPATFTFQATGQASGGLNPSLTTFTETGNFTIAAGSSPSGLVMTDFQASYSFPITTPPGQVTGVKTLNPAGLNQVFHCDATGAVNFNVSTNYTAQIATTGGTVIDQGTSNPILIFFASNNLQFSESFLSTGSNVQTCTAPPPGMVSWWPGDGNTTDIQGTNNGSWVGASAFAPGEVGSAFSFAGSSFVTVPAGSGSSLDITGNQVTIDGWINPSVVSKDAIYFGKTAYGFNAYVLLSDFQNPAQLIGIVKTCSGFANCEHLIGGFLPFVVPANQWTHIAMTYDGITLKLYANGIVIGSEAVSGNITGEGSEFDIGGRTSDPFVDHHMIGLTDEVEVFNRALSESEIQAIFFAGSAGKCKGSTQAPQSTTLSFTTASATMSDFDDAAMVQARLTRMSDGSGVSSKTVTFTLGGGAGAPTCSAMTDATGTAMCSLTPNQAAGSYMLMASFSGDTSFAPSSTSTSFTVTKEETTTAFTATNPTAVANGSSATFSATLKEEGVTPIASRTLTFTLGSGAGAQSCSAVTDAGGMASCSITVNQPSGSNTVKAVFAGDGYYLPSSDTRSVLVFAFAGGGGTFVIGDGNAAVGNAVEFWGSQWAKLNSLSGGAAPNSFKGFADQTSPVPAACGGRWNTLPGNSSHPPNTIPPYMAVVVSSSIAQSGQTISGDIVRVAVIQTNPGYAGDPGHAGTGTVVAVLPCH